MCGRFYVGGDFRDKLNDLMRSENIAPASVEAGFDIPAYKAAGQDVFPSNESTVICRAGGLLSGAGRYSASGADDAGRHSTAGTDRLVAARMNWGFANPYRKGLIINARAETAHQKRLFSDSLLNRRCVIPASGFYEWDPAKARFRFTEPEGGLLLLAGLYREEQGKPHYTILTTEANDSMRPVHDRMPVMIGRDEIRPWITDNERVAEFLERPQVRLVSEQDSGQIRMDFGLTAGR